MTCRCGEPAERDRYMCRACYDYWCEIDDSEMDES